MSFVGSFVDEIETQVASVTHSTINTNITSRLGGISGIDRGTISVSNAQDSNTATIGAVVLARSPISSLGERNASFIDRGDGDYAAQVGIELTNTTTVTAYCLSANRTLAAVVGYQVVEHSA